MECVAESHELIFDVLRGDYPRVDFGRVRLVLINSGEQILEGIDPSLANAATRRLASQKVEIINNVKAKEIRPGTVTLSDGRSIPARTTVWVWVCPVCTDCLPLSHSISSQSNLFVL